MRHRCSRRAILTVTGASALLATAATSASAQMVKVGPGDRRTEVPLVYVHAGAGFGMDLLLSSSLTDRLTDTVGDNIGIGLGLPSSFVGRIGVREWAQVEYRRTDSSHDFNQTGFVDGGGVGGTGIGTTASVPMDYDSNEWAVKVNPFFRWRRALFLQAGRGDAKWQSADLDVRFDGDFTMLGIEMGVVRRYFSGGVALKRYGMDLGTDVLTTTTRRVGGRNVTTTSRDRVNYPASNWAFEVTGAVGIGFR